MAAKKAPSRKTPTPEDPFYKPHNVKGSLKNGEEYSDSAITSLYESIISLINNEAQLVWSRYNAMLVANSFLAAILGTELIKDNWSTKDAIVMILVGLLGLLLSFQWRGMTSKGFELQHHWLNYAKSFKWKNYENPLQPYEHWERKTTGRNMQTGYIATYAHRAILLFIISYIITILVGMFILIPF